MRYSVWDKLNLFLMMFNARTSQVLVNTQTTKPPPLGTKYFRLWLVPKHLLFHFCTPHLMFFCIRELTWLCLYIRGLAIWLEVFHDGNAGKSSDCNVNLMHQLFISLACLFVLNRNRFCVVLQMILDYTSRKTCLPQNVGLWETKHCRLTTFCLPAEAHFVSRLKIFSSNCHCFRILTFLLWQGISHFNPSYTAVSVTVNGFGLATLMIWFISTCLV